MFYKDEALRRYIAKEKNLDYEKIVIKTVNASESHTWSTYTQEDFSVSISYEYGGMPESTYWDERDVVKFLNWFVEDEQRT